MDACWYLAQFGLRTIRGKFCSPHTVLSIMKYSLVFNSYFIKSFSYLTFIPILIAFPSTLSATAELLIQLSEITD